MSWWICGVLPLGALLLQTAVLPGTAVAGVRPNFLLLTVVAVAMLQKRQDRALVCGAVSGLMVDFTYGRFIGLNLLLLVAVAWAAHQVARAFMRPSLLLSGAGAGAFSLAVGFARAAVSMLAGIPLGGLAVLGMMLLTAAAYDGLLMAAIHGVVILKP